MDNQKSPVKFTQTTASVLLDLIRGLAAMLVLVDHWRNFLFVGYQYLQAGGRLRWALLSTIYLATSAGHQAVVIFFVLSGYLISGSVFRSMERNTWGWGNYLLHRLSRLWVVLIPGLLLGLLMDKSGMRFGHAPHFYFAAFPGARSSIATQLSPGIFFANLFFLQTIKPFFGSNGALWSLSYEFWYYLLFPLGLIALRKQFSVPVRLGNAALFCLTAWFVRGQPLEMFSIWLMGVGLALVPAPRVGARTRWLAACVYVPLVFWVSKFHAFSATVEDAGFAVVTTAFLWILLSAREKVREGGVFARGSRGLSRFSYTLYVVHMPFLVLMLALLVGDRAWQPTLRYGIVGAGVLLLTVVYAWLVASLTEFHTDKVRAWVERHVFHKRAEPPTPHEAVLAAEIQR